MLNFSQLFYFDKSEHNLNILENVKSPAKIVNKKAFERMSFYITIKQMKKSKPINYPTKFPFTILDVADFDSIILSTKVDVSLV